MIVCDFDISSRDSSIAIQPVDHSYVLVVEEYFTVSTTKAIICEIILISNILEFRFSMHHNNLMKLLFSYSKIYLKENLNYTKAPPRAHPLSHNFPNDDNANIVAAEVRLCLIRFHCVEATCICFWVRTYCVLYIVSCEFKRICAVL